MKNFDIDARIEEILNEDTLVVEELTEEEGEAMDEKIDRFYEDVNYFKSKGVDFRELLKIVCYKDFPFSVDPAKKWLDKLDSQVRADGVLVLDIQDVFIMEGIRKKLGDEIARLLMQGEIHIPKHELSPAYNFNRRRFIDFKYVDKIVFNLSGDICILIDNEILKDKE